MFTMKASHSWDITSLVFSPDGRHLLANGDIYELNTRTKIANSGGWFLHSPLTYSVDGRYIFQIGYGRGVFVTEIETKAFVQVLASNSLSNFVLTSNNQMLASRYRDRDTNFTGLWDVSNPLASSIIWQSEKPSTPYCSHLAVSPDLQTYAAVESRGLHPPKQRLAINRVSDGKIVRVIKELGSHHNYLALYYHPSGESLVLVGTKMYVFDVKSRKQIRTISPPQGGRFQAVAMHPNGRYLLSLHRSNGLVNVWNLDSFEISHSYQWPIKKGASLAISPDGLMCAVGDSQGNIVVWDWED